MPAKFLTKDILRIILVLAVFFLVAPYLLRGMLSLFYSPQVVIRYKDAVKGQVTGIYRNRQHNSFYLNGSKSTYYDFNSFVPPGKLARIDSLPQDEINNLVLGAYLQEGDSVTKEANTTMLVVKRGSMITQWECSPNPLAE
jgi:hypothetical protein